MSIANKGCNWQTTSKVSIIFFGVSHFVIVNIYLACPQAKATFAFILAFWSASSLVVISRDSCSANPVPSWASFVPTNAQHIWSLTQFYSVGFFKQGSVQKVWFLQTYKQGLPQLSLKVSLDVAPSTAHQKLFRFLCISRSNTRGKSRSVQKALQVSNSNSKTWELLGGSVKSSPNRMSLICPPSKSKIQYKKIKEIK